MFDFDAIVINPLMGVFGRPTMFKPVVSQPGIAPFGGRGVYALRAVEVPTPEGIFSTNQPTLGIRLADFLVPPVQGDFVTVNGVGFEIVDVVPDGQGGADLALREATLP